VLFAAPALAETADVTRVIVLSSSEVIAMGGAGIGFAAGAGGLVFQPASPANRPVESKSKFALSFAMNSMAFGPGRPSDVGNVGTADGWSGNLGNLGLSGAYGNGGVGILGSTMRYDQGDNWVQVTEGHVDAAYALASDHLVAGIGWRTLVMDAYSGEDYASFTQNGPEIGLMGVDIWGGWNVGGVYRAPVKAPQSDGNLDLPVNGASVGPQVAAGLGWHTTDETPIPVRVAADVVVDGAVERGLALEALLANVEVDRGTYTTVSPRIGVEAEVWRDRLRWRGGGYLEPTRTDLAPDRIHYTTGFELKLFRLKLFKGAIDEELSWEAAVDVADRYLNLGWLGIGFWSRGLVKGGLEPG
jgi:hypothetical protein